MDKLTAELFERAGGGYHNGQPDFGSFDLDKFTNLVKEQCAEACTDFACGRTHSPADLIDSRFTAI